MDCICKNYGFFIFFFFFATELTEDTENLYTRLQDLLPAWCSRQISLVKRALSQIFAFDHQVIFQCPICEAGINILLDTDLHKIYLPPRLPPLLSSTRRRGGAAGAGFTRNLFLVGINIFKQDFPLDLWGYSIIFKGIN